MENKVTFRCERSGNTVSFSSEDDIKHMQAQEGYIEVVPEAITVAKSVKEVKEVKKPAPKRRGRPPKE